MKNVKRLLCLGLMSLSTFCFANGVKSMKNLQPEASTHYVVTVKQALSALDDTSVSITGNIISFDGDDDYLFADATGTIEVEIEAHLLDGLLVTPTTQVIIVGEVEKEWRDIAIEVDSLTIIEKGPHL